MFKHHNIIICILKVFRKFYLKAFGSNNIQSPLFERNPNVVSDMIYETLMSDKSCMIARYGSTELSCIVNYLGVKKIKFSAIKFIQGRCPEFWWNYSILSQMQQWSGFFPATIENVGKFCELMLEDSKQVDLLASWQKQELYMKDYLGNARFFKMSLLSPYWGDKHWTRAFRGKKILVVHPFAELIEKQYEKRKYLFDNDDIMPDFLSFKVIKAVQSLGGVDNGFKDWFEALDYMKNRIDECDYDICLLGCGAYGFPLAAHCKRMGKKAIHWGGALQLYFGIMGNRWENEKPYYDEGRLVDVSSLVNEYWVKPGKKERPTNYKHIENACYW